MHKITQNAFQRNLNSRMARGSPLLLIKNNNKFTYGFAQALGPYVKVSPDLANSPPPLNPFHMRAPFFMHTWSECDRGVYVRQNPQERDRDREREKERERKIL